MQEICDGIPAGIHPVQAREREAAEHAVAPARHAAVFSQRIELCKTDVEIAVEAVRLADESIEPENVRVKYDQDEAQEHQQRGAEIGVSENNSV
jgi:hypothetical protein